MCFRLSCLGNNDDVYDPEPARMDKPAQQHNGRYNTGGAYNHAHHAAAEAGRKASNDVRKGGYGHTAVPAGAVAKGRHGHAGANDDAMLKQHQHAAWNAKVAGAGDGHYYSYHHGREQQQPAAHRENAAEFYHPTTAAAHHGRY